MLENYFEQFGHKCSVNLNNPFEGVLANKSRLRLWLMNQMVISPTKILLRGRPRSYSPLRDEILYHLKNYPYMLHPYSSIVFYWEFFWMLIIYYWLIVLPFDVFRNMSYDVKWNHAAKHINLLMAVVCTIDIIRRFFTGFAIQHQHRDEIILDLRGVCSHYVRTYFVIDLVSSLPVIVGLYFPGSRECYLIVEFLLLLKVVRLVTILKITKILMRYYQVDYNLNSILCTFICLIFTVHWVTCFSILAGAIHRRFHPIEYQWYDGLEYQSASLFTRYMIFLHRSSSILTGTGFHFVSESQTADDMIYLILTAILGRAVTACVLAKIYEKVIGMRSASAKYEDIIHEIEAYMKRKKLKPQMRNKIKVYYNYKFEQSYFKEDAILNVIPFVLKKNILLHCAKLLLDNLDFFKKLPDTILANLVLQFEKEIIVAGDVIFRAGETDFSTYFLLSGTVASFSKSGREVHHLGDGSHFGITTISEYLTPVATKVALETCEVAILQKRNLFKLFNLCPDVFRQIEKHSEIRKAKVQLIEERFQAFYNKYLLLQKQAEEREANILETPHDTNSEIMWEGPSQIQ